MATHQHNLGGAAGLPLALIGQAVRMLSRHDLEALAERLIDRLDQVDGDPDIEDDDPAGQCDEDEVNTAYASISRTVGGDGPGCPLCDDDHSYY